MSGSPRSEQFGDIYFAVENGLEETKHVFLAGNRLPDRWQGRPQFTIAETGFGTGLNFLSVWKCFEENSAPSQRLHFISFEKYPLSGPDILRYLSHWTDEIGPYLKRLVDLYPVRVTGWHTLHLNERVSLLLIFDDVNRAMSELDISVDAWFLDGHAPAKNPDMWSETVFAGMARLSTKGATVATFTAAGIAKRGLKSAGFEVEKCRGFGRKRDMLKAVRAEGRQIASVTPVQSVAVIGAGLAGLTVAYALNRAGMTVDVFEGAGVAAGASGNPLGLYNPRLSAHKTADSDFYGSAYALALRTFKACKDIEHQAVGALHLITDEDKRARFGSLLDTWGWHQDHVRLLDENEASQIAGIRIPHSALYLPDSGSVSPAGFCRELACDLNIYARNVTEISHDGSVWKVDGKDYDAVVIANAAACLSFEQTKDLPLQTVRGQISFAKATESTADLKTNLCYGGYCSASVGGVHTIGATFQPWLQDCSLREEDHAQVLENLISAIPSFSGQLQINGGRASLRTASKDRRPVGGRIEDQPPHLYVSVAHGSHGILSSLMIAEHVAAQISGLTQALPRSVIDHIAPGRFSERDRRKAG